MLWFVGIVVIFTTLSLVSASVFRLWDDLWDVHPLLAIAAVVALVYVGWIVAFRIGNFVRRL